MSVIGSNILAGASGQGGGYTIERSVRLRSSASAYLSRTPASASNRKTWTWSGWVKRGNLGGTQTLFDGGASGPLTLLQLTSDQLRLYVSNTSITASEIPITSAVFRDPSAWYHIVCVTDTTETSATNRVKFYINGVQQTITGLTGTIIGLNADLGINRNIAHNIGRYAYASTHYLDGYLTEINFIDGQALAPTYFGEYNADTGVWQPIKYTGTYGTNGFYLNFSDNSTTTTLGYDTSGNGNNWTANNISVTSGATYDSMTDVPTLTSETAGNYCVINPLVNLAAGSSGNGTISDANLKVSWSGSLIAGTRLGTIGVSSDKWYFESTWTDASASTAGVGFIGGDGVADDGRLTISSGGTYMCAVDMDNLLVWFGVNGTWTGDPSAGTGGTSIPDIGTRFPFFRDNSGTSGNDWTVVANFGQQPFAYTPPTGFKSLNTYNLPDSTIVDGSQYFNTVLYTGNGATNHNITGVGFQPDFVWLKERTSTSFHQVLDAVRGAGVRLETNDTGAETTPSPVGLSSFDADGFTVENNNGYNENSQTYVAWNWKANGSGVSNTDGSITSTVSANTTAGFSIVTYTGTGANATVGHGLGVAPAMVIVKERANTNNWPVYHKDLSVSNARLLYLNTTNSELTSSSAWNNTDPTSTVVHIGTQTEINQASQPYVAYCFAEVEGFSKFGSYTGNGSADGVFVHLNFRARYLLIKETGNANSWEVYDTARNVANVQTQRLFPNDAQAEATTNPSLDILSNGFKCRAGNTGINRSGGTYIYMAFAENPFKNALAR